MNRGRRIVLVVAALTAAAFAGEARAQWGYGSYPGGYSNYGWGGWGGGGTVQGSIARGLGAYAMGRGSYNVNTAQARSINADTAMRWNEYWYQSQVNANRNERARLARRQARDSGTSAANEAHVRDNPTTADIEDGDALNAALDQISDPRVQSSALRLATAKVAGKLVRDLPFFVPTESASFALDQITAEAGWPLALRDAGFDAERKAVAAAVDAALAEDVKGDLTPQSIQRVRAAAARLHDKFEANKPDDVNARNDAEDYLKTLTGVTRLLERPDIDKVLAELDSIKETTLGSLLGFMHTFNLRFGKPKTPAQRAAYAAIYPQLDALRDQVVKADEGSDKPVATATTPPTEFLGGLPYDHLEGPHRNLDKPGQ